jgi:trehalose-phosphatase
MENLSNKIKLDSFWDSLSEAPHSVLMLDYDGTLAPFVTDRNKAVPYPGVRQRLTALLDSTRTRLVIISGRAVEDLKPLLGIQPMPELWGSHGLERLDEQGRYKTASQGEKPAEGLAAVYWWARDNSLLEYTERKPLGIGFHWRGLPEQEHQRIREAVLSRWQGDLSQYDLELHGFDGGLEVRCRGISKADAVKSILDETPRETVLAYLGDDATDEDAFRTLGDRGLSILVRDELRDTAADIWLQPPEEMLQFLDRWQRLTV